MSEDVYDPTDEYDEIEESSDISAIGAGRRKTLDAIEAKDTLDDPQSFGSLQEMKNAVRQISLAHPDGRTFMAPPEDALERIDWAYNDLPDEAHQEYLNDHRLYVKIRAARNRFNDWMGKRRRRDQIPSTMEAGPSNYPTKKANKTSEYERDAKEELDEAIDKIRAAAKGARQRALEAIGSSVAEQNQQEAEEQADTMKGKLAPGEVVSTRDTSYGRALWGVKRLNKKSVRLKRPHQSAGMEIPMSDGETYDEFDLTTVDYDSRYLTHIPREELDDFDEDGDFEVPVTEGYEATIRFLMGDDWVEDNLGADLEPDDASAPDDGPALDDEERETIREAVQDGDFTGLIRAVHVDKPLATRDWESYASIESAEDFVEHYEENGDFEAVRGVGPSTSEDIEEAVPIVRDALEESTNDSTTPELPPYKLNVTKSQSGTGPSQYPSHDRVIVQITVPSEPLPTDYAFPFTGEKRVATALDDQHIFHRILRNHGIEPVKDAHGVWDATVSTFSEAGVGRGDSVDKTDETNPEDTESMEDTDDETAEEWTDNRAQQDTLGTEDPTQHRESKVAEGSEEFADDRDVYDPTEEVGSQASLAPEEAGDEGQVDLTGERATEDPEWDDSSDDDGDEWTEALEYVRDQYDDSFQARNEFANDLMSWGRENDVYVPKQVGWEGVGQPILRFQDIPPGDAYLQIEAEIGDVEMEELVDAMVQFANDGAARADVQDAGDIYDPIDEWGPTMDRPISDVYDDLVRPREEQIKEEQEVHIDTATGRHRSDLDDPNELDQHEEMMGEADGPTTDQDDQEDTQQAGAVEGADTDDQSPTETEESERDDSDGPESNGVNGHSESIEFVTLPAANEFRDEFEEHLHPSDHRSYKTVEIDAGAPEDVLDEAGKRVQISSQDETKKYGQAELTDQEQNKLERMYEDWQWGTHGFQAMSVKAALQAEGATDWMNYYEPGMDQDGAVRLLETGKEAAAAGRGQTATKGSFDDTEKDPGEIGTQMDKAEDEACDQAADYAEHEGDESAAEFLVSQCGWSESDVEQLLAAAERMGEDPQEIYDPTAETDNGQSFEEWARQSEPEPPTGDVPDRPAALVEPSDEELAQIAPTPTPDEMTGPALRALKKAWAGYKAARAESRQQFEDAEEYASVINGIRAVNNQEPIDFDSLEWEGGDVMPDDPSETYPAPEGTNETMAEAADHGHASTAAQSILNRFTDVAGSEPWDPTEDL